ncbi:hypothetical protein NDU88_008436 [Pleurodeles waltl]|uniref:Uncharacterized protein n=1 Tax=Pleurodeles waltl TaxID=8319 RepID=A0AAV7N4Y7_PLEWA|nr:hypothetical protein NDU88_008436 [Pleurodeles waltl]
MQDATAGTGAVEQGATRGSNGRGPDDRVNDCNDREELLPDRPSPGSRSSELHWFRADLSRVIYGPDWEPSGVPRQIRRVEDDQALEAEDEKLSMRSGWFCPDRLLEMNHPAPLEGTPNKDMFTKYGLVAVAYSKLWHKYTKKDSESQWPLMGSFDDHKIETLEIALRSNKTTPTMLDSIGMWRKETTQRKKREEVKAEKELRKAAHLVARKLEEEIKERKEAKQKQESETSGQCPVRTPSTLYPE